MRKKARKILFEELENRVGNGLYSMRKRQIEIMEL